MAPTADGVLAAIGRTPTVRLRRALPGHPGELWAKLESLNPGGSIKDRAAIGIVERAVSAGTLIRGRSTVIESSSGNLAIGLAQACAVNDIRLICVVDARTTLQNRAIMAAYGARVDVVDRPDPHTGEFLTARAGRVQELLRRTPDSFWPNQHANPANARSQEQVMEEIHAELGEIDHLFVAVGTCGTLRGCAEYISSHGLTTRVVGVDAVGSVIFGRPAGPRLIPGHGAAVRPGLYRDGLADNVVHVSDRDCVTGCRRLVRTEGILAGGSSGGVLSAVRRMAPQLLGETRSVMILPDRGERYLDTIYDDSWVTEHFGPIDDSFQKEISC